MIQKQPNSNDQQGTNAPTATVTADHAQQATNGTAPSLTQASSSAPITIFALPKPFNEQTETIQRNAIQSWQRLAPDVEVLLLGDDAGIASTAKELGVKHVGGVEANEAGTPLVSSAFKLAHENTTSPVLVYCNSDVILMKDFVRAIHKLHESEALDSFLAIGRRTDLKVERLIDFDSLHDVEKLLDDCAERGDPASIACKEYFAFTRDLFQNVPAFAVGRGNWDNWMVANTKQEKIPVVSLSKCVKVIHQEHDYSHMKKSRLQCYVNGEEARENQRLANGRNLVSGSTSTHRLEAGNVLANRSIFPAAEFIRDLPRFAKLLLSLATQR